MFIISISSYNYLSLKLRDMQTTVNVGNIFFAQQRLFQYFFKKKTHFVTTSLNNVSICLKLIQITTLEKKIKKTFLSPFK